MSNTIRAIALAAAFLGVAVSGPSYAQETETFADPGARAASPGVPYMSGSLARGTVATDYYGRVLDGYSGRPTAIGSIGAPRTARG